MMNVCVKASKSPSPQMVEEEEEEAVHFGKILFERLHNQPDDHIAYVSFNLLCFYIFIVGNI